MLTLLADYLIRVRNAMSYEVPTYEMPALLAFMHKSDDEISNAMARSLPFFVGKVEAWNEMGMDFHDRLRKNDPRLGRGYPRAPGSSFPIDKGRLKGAKLDWSIGGDTPAATFYDNVVRPKYVTCRENSR